LFGRPRTFNASEEKVSAEKLQSEGNDMKGGTLTEGKLLVRNNNLDFATFCTQFRVWQSLGNQIRQKIFEYILID
jgi:hypothetical protein